MTSAARLLAASVLLSSLPLTWAEEAGQGLLLPITISRQGSELMRPTLWGPVGSSVSAANAEGLSIEVQGEPAADDRVTLHLRLTDAGLESTRHQRVTVTVPLGKRVRVQLGPDAATATVVELTPRMSARPDAAVPRP